MDGADQMSEHTYLQCVWREWKTGALKRCRKTAETCIIYGCLEGHIEEFVTCYHHFSLWAHMVNQHSQNCGCGALIDSWERVPIRELTPGFALYMRGRQ
jgi:hypothetical protein